MPGLEGFVGAYGVAAAVGAALAMALGGFAKGVVGFALPLIALSLAGSFLPYQTAVALLIVPMLVSNLFQALRNGIGPALGQPPAVLVAEPGAGDRDRAVGAAGRGAAGPGALRHPRAGGLRSSARASCSGGGRGCRRGTGWPSRPGVAALAGFFGGLSGIWGPPLIMYLLAVGLPKTEMVRVQSLSFLLGAMVLFVAHLHSGVLNAVTLPASAWLVLPTMAAMFLGYRVHDRLDQARFLKVTLVVLVLTGLNLLRRALF